MSSFNGMARAAALLLTLALLAPAAARGQERPRRAFLHEYHRSLACTSCHTEGGQHGVPRNWSDESCASCHHDPARGLTCDACHRRESYVEPRPVAQTLHLSVWNEPRTREISFDHHLHVRLECRGCHEGNGLLEPPACASCHVNHHRVGVDCAQCHRPPDPGVHGLEAHVSCGGSGCHSDAATRRPMLSRPSCLICHATKRDHRPGRECASCHIVPQGSPTDTAQALRVPAGGTSNPSLP